MGRRGPGWSPAWASGCGCPRPCVCSQLLLTPSLPVFPEEDGLEPKAAVQKELSDMDYLKSKVVRAGSPSSSSEEEESEDEAENCEDSSEAEEGGHTAPSAQDRARPETGPEPEAARAQVSVLGSKGVAPPGTRPSPCSPSLGDVE